MNQLMKLALDPNDNFLRKTLRLFLYAAVLYYSALPLYAQDGKQQAFMGVASCSSSNCHGNTSPMKGSNVLQNEYVTWYKHDKHAKAWVNLTNADSQKIAKNLGIVAAEKEQLCLECHSTKTAGRSVGEKFRVDDGVSCEACHGAAGGYLDTHTASDSTHAKNLANGMADIHAPLKRAQLCLGCHYGDENKTVNHRLIGAGHPRLSFELDTFSMIQPAHWLVDDDYKKRKGDYVSAHAWLVGQVKAASEMTAALLSEKRSQYGRMPELTLLYCFACHHSLTEDQWKVRDYGGKPGELKLNISALIIVREAFKVLKPGIADAINTQLASLHEAYQNGSEEGPAQAIQKSLNEALQLANDHNFTDAELTKLLHQIVRFGAESGELQYEVAEQLAMAMSSIISTTPGNGKLYQSELQAIYKALGSSEAFRASDFTEACKSFSAKI